MQSYRAFRDSGSFQADPCCVRAFGLLQGPDDLACHSEDTNSICHVPITTVDGALPDQRFRLLPLARHPRATLAHFPSSIPEIMAVMI